MQNRTYNVIIFVSMHILCIVALFHASKVGVLCLFLGWLLTGIGISVGYHRLITHKSFKAPPLAEKILTLFGLLAMQGGPLTWLAIHKTHHACSDSSEDPHSASAGFIYSQFGWIFNSVANRKLARFFAEAKKAYADNLWMIFLEQYNAHISVGLLVLAATTLPFATFLWAFPLRIVLVWHLTWLVNSIGHSALEINAKPRNLPWLSLLTFGEGLHATHHCNPSSPNFGSKSLDWGGFIVSTFFSDRPKSPKGRDLA